MCIGFREDLRNVQMAKTATYMGRIRYRQALSPITLHKKPEGLYITFEEMQRGITPGQFAAWYQNDEQIGSGVID